MLMQQKMQQTSQLAATIHQLTQVHQAQQAQLAGGATDSSPGPRQARSRNPKVFDGRYLKHKMFDGTPWKYDDRDFKQAIRSANSDAYQLLIHVERPPSSKACALKKFVPSCKICCVKRARATSCVAIRAVDDTHGLMAWQKLYKNYNPKTVARAIRLVGTVTHLPKVKELKHVEAGLHKSEEQGEVLKKDFGEQFSETVRVGIVTVMMLESIHGFVFSSLGIAVEYETIIAKIRASVSNKDPS